MSYLFDASVSRRTSAGGCLLRLVTPRARLLHLFCSACLDSGLQTGNLQAGRHP